MNEMPTGLANTLARSGFETYSPPLSWFLPREFSRESTTYSLHIVMPAEVKKMEYHPSSGFSQDRESRSITFGVVENPPYVMVHKKLSLQCNSESLPCIQNSTRRDETSKEKCCSGFAIQVLKMVIQQERLQPKIVLRHDGIAGTQENGSWTGIVDDLIKGNIDMSPNLFPSARRSKVLDFTDPYMPSGISLLTKETERVHNGIYWITYMRPLTLKLWLALAGSAALMIGLLWMVEKLSPVDTDTKLFHWEVSFGIDNAVCYVLQLAFGRPVDEKKPRTQGAKFAGLAFGIGMMILMATYSANLAAFLIITDMTTPVDGIYHEKVSNSKRDVSDWMNEWEGLE